MITNKHFIDWEKNVFGYGYGYGEKFTLTALKQFFESLEHTMYSYEVLEQLLGEISAWLLINTLCHADIIDYGTSPRFGFLTKKGELISSFVKDKSVQELYDLVMNANEEYIYCQYNRCNCDISCDNPLFIKK